MADYDPKWAAAISSIESSGDYNQVTPSPGGRAAYGKYQVMGENIPEWTQAALGKSMSPQEFTANPDAQDAVFKHRFGGYVDQYGSPQDAASAWFTGRPINSQSAQASDKFGTTGASYVSKFNRAMADGPTAIDAAMGRTRSPTGSRMALAAEDDEEDTPKAAPPALSAAATLGQGALGAGGMSATQKPNWLDVLGSTLMNMAPGIAQDAPTRSALASAAAAQAKLTDNGTWSHITLPNGQVARINSKQGIPQVMNTKTGAWELANGNYAADDKQKWGIVKAADPSKGTPAEYGFPPSKEDYAASHTPEMQAAAAQAAAASAVDSNATGPEFLASLTKNRGGQYANSVQAIVEGRALMPTASSRAPGAQQLRADALQADRTLQEGTGPARVKLRQSYTTATAPNSPAVQMRMGNVALEHGANLSDEIEAVKAYNDHADGFIPGSSYAANYLHNKALAGQSTPEAQAYSSLQTHINNFASEKAKFLGGGVAGEHEKARVLALYDMNKSLPELRAGMAADAEDVMAKHGELQNGWRTGNDNSPLVPDFPVVSKEGQAGYDRITERHNRTAGGGYVQPNGSAPIPTGQSRVGVPMKDRPPLSDIFK